MGQQERDKILTASHNLELRELTLEPWFDPYSDMITEEKSKLIIELMSFQKSDRERINSLMDKLDRMAESQLAANEASTLLGEQLSALMNLLKEKEAAYRILQSENDALVEQLKVNRKTMYGSKSQKGISKKKDNKPFREEDKDQSRFEYRTMKAGKSVSHHSDMNKLPQDAKVLATYNTIISTCKMHGISALEFFKKFFYEIMLGRRDYENLLPMTIGIKPNKF
ncbi:hypothetical protein [Bacteroides sp.]